MSNERQGQGRRLYYIAEEVANELHISVNRVRELAKRKSDPISFRLLFVSERGMFVSRDELIEWVERNSRPLNDARHSDDGERPDRS